MVECRSTAGCLTVLLPLQCHLAHGRQHMFHIYCGCIAHCHTSSAGNTTKHPTPPTHAVQCRQHMPSSMLLALIHSVNAADTTADKNGMAASACCQAHNHYLLYASPNNCSCADSCRTGVAQTQQQLLTSTAQARTLAVHTFSLAICA